MKWTRGTKTVLEYYGHGATLWSLLPSFVTQFIITLVSALLLTVYAAYEGLKSSIPVPYLIASVIVIFGGTFWAFLQTSLWRERTRVRDKLVFAGPYIGVRRETPNGGPVVGVKLGMKLQNRASFSLEFHVDEIRTWFGTSLNPHPKYVARRFIVGSYNEAFFYDDEIEVSISPNDIKEGVVEFLLSYGRPGKLSYKLEKKFSLYCGFDEGGGLAILNYSDASIR